MRYGLILNSFVCSRCVIAVGSAFSVYAAGSHTCAGFEWKTVTSQIEK
jgi:hypothetical protein